MKNINRGVNMENYVCTIDEDYYKKLLSKGYVFSYSYLIENNKKVFVLMPPKNVKNYDKLDKNKCFFTNKRFFKGGE